jgi:hypothetical protein
MEYFEADAIIDLSQTGMPYFRTGSREICNPAPYDTDVDFVVLDINGNVSFEKNGYNLSSDVENYDPNDVGSFQTYRRGEVNLVVIHSWESFRAWKAATAAAKQMNLTDKGKRIALFQGVLYGNW